jgi:dTDP-4-dehydrorhamnose 3,5-epimerase
VACASGAIIDVVVDLRVGCPTIARWKAVQLDDEKRCAVFISEGLGHAFVALSEQATVMYLCSTPYAPGIEHGVHPLDPDLGIAWPREIEPLDAAGPSLDEAQRDGLLPLYSDCMAFAAQLKETAAPGPDRATGAPRQPGEPSG